MYQGLRIVAIVTARGGSKGLPGKNIKNLNGKPLLAWTLDQIKESKYIDEVFVSTDSEEIADVCKQYGVSVPQLRPAYLAEDNTPSIDVLEYTIQYLKDSGKEFDFVLLLEPTSPLRKKGDLDNIIKLAGENQSYDGVISVGEVHTEHPSIIKKVTQEGTIIPYLRDISGIYQRQQCDKAYFPYGVGYLIKTSILLEKHVIYTNRVLPYFIERWQNYEVDDIYDFVCIESIMKMEADKL